MKDKETLDLKFQTVNLGFLTRSPRPVEEVLAMLEQASFPRLYSPYKGMCHAIDTAEAHGRIAEVEAAQAREAIRIFMQDLREQLGVRGAFLNKFVTDRECRAIYQDWANRYAIVEQGIQHD